MSSEGSHCPDILINCDTDMRQNYCIDSMRCTNLIRQVRSMCTHGANLSNLEHQCES